jgi:predicted phosphate transport protein (TIGR00153 family)
LSGVSILDPVRRARRRRSTFGARPPQSELLALLADAGGNLERTAELLHDLLLRWPDASDLRREITRCEQEGDRITHKVVDRLHRSRMAAAEREDVYALTGAIDDVVDDLEEVSEELAIYQIEAPMEQAQGLAAIARDSARALRQALDGLRRLEGVEEELAEIRRLEHEGDRLFRAAVASLFETSIDPIVVIRWKDVYQGLEDSIDRCRQAADIMQSIIVKHT